MANPSINTNPWKGLNFYKEGEIIYGRNDEIESLARYILNNTQTVLYGKSGIGKSSILNAGIFPIARAKGMIPVAVRLDHSNDVSYIEQIRDAVAESGADAHEVLPPIDEKTETLWEYLHRNIFFDANGNRTQLLIVFDQFEEVFTLQQNEKVKRAFFEEIADLINDVTPLYIINADNKGGDKPAVKTEEVAQSLTDIDIDLNLDDVGTAASPRRYLEHHDHHIVFTLREDFLSYLERYTAYIPAMKSNRFALLPLNEEQASEIIMKPVPGMVDKGVAQLIIQKVTGKSDFELDGIPELDVDAAVLSLYLSRLYIKKEENSRITADLVNQFSEDIIKDFYEESVADLPPVEIEKIEDQLLTYDGRRNNVSRGDLVREGVSDAVLNTLVDDRKLLRQFSYQDDIRVEYMHDILCPIVDERIENREEARRMAEEQRKQEEEQRKFMEEEQRKREEIEANAYATLEAMKVEAAAQKRKNKRRLVAALAALFVSALAWLLWFTAYRMPIRTNYASFTTQKGWPVGIGKKVNASDRNEMPLYYQLVRYGFRNKITRVNVMNWDKQIVTNVFEESPLVGLFESDGADKAAAKFALMQRQTAYWIYTPDKKGNILRKTAYNINGEELYSIQFYHSDAQEQSARKQLWANFIDKDGQPLHVRDNGVDRMRVTIDSLGYYSGYMFFNETGIPLCNLQNAYGYKYILNNDGVLLRKDALDEFGEPIKDEGTAYLNIDEYGRWRTANNASASYYANSSKKEAQNYADSLHFNPNGTLSYCYYSYGNASHIFKYDEDGKLTENISFIGDSLTNAVVYNYFEGTEDIKTCTWYSPSTGYLTEVHALADSANTVTYYGGMTTDAMEPINSGKGYHRQVSQMQNDERILTYYEIDSCGNERLMKEERYAYDENGFVVRHIATDGNGKRTLSMEYEIENGVVVGQHVIGLHDSIIRNAEWDEYEFNYYRMRFIRDFKGVIVARKAFNEFGDESLVTYKDFEMKTILASRDTILENDTCYTNATIAFQDIVTNANAKNKVKYLHITDLDGEYYKCGLRDGDLVLDRDLSHVEVARSNPAKDRYDIIIFRLEEGQSFHEDKIGDTIYDVYFTNKEMRRLQESIRKAKSNK